MEIKSTSKTLLFSCKELKRWTRHKIKTSLQMFFFISFGNLQVSNKKPSLNIRHFLQDWRCRKLCYCRYDIVSFNKGLSTFEITILRSSLVSVRPRKGCLSWFIYFLCLYMKACDVEMHFTRLRHRLKNPCTDRRLCDVPSSLLNDSSLYSPDVIKKTVATFGPSSQLIYNNLAAGHGILFSHLLTTLDTWCRRIQNAKIASNYVLSITWPL
jgi:hypothetical protein